MYFPDSHTLITQKEIKINYPYILEAEAEHENI